MTEDVINVVPLASLDAEVQRHVHMVHPEARAMVCGPIQAHGPNGKLEQMGQPRTVRDAQHTVYLTTAPEGMWVRVVIFRPAYGFGWAKMLAFTTTEPVP